MKYERTESFKRDYQRLNSSEREEFREAVRDSFVPAAEKLARQDGSNPWPAKLRVKGVKGAPGVWEMTWSFKDPDGRATFEWVRVDGEPAIRWRRVGSHAIFKDP